MAKMCTVCGKEILDGVAFCTECGTKAPAENPLEVKTEAETASERKCRQCGSTLKEGVAFCTECGAEVAESGKAELEQETEDTTPNEAETPTEGGEPEIGEKTTLTVEEKEPFQSIQAQPPPKSQPQPGQPAPQQPVYQNPQAGYPSAQQIYTQPAYQSPQPTYAPPVYHQPPPTYTQPTGQAYAAPPTKSDDSGVVGTGVFFGSMFLFALPILGFIACIIMCTSAKKKSLRNYAKANLIWAIIGLVFGVLLIVGMIILGGQIIDYVKELINSGLGEVSGTG